MSKLLKDMQLVYQEAAKVVDNNQRGIELAQAIIKIDLQEHIHQMAYKIIHS